MLCYPITLAEDTDMFRLIHDDDHNMNYARQQLSLKSCRDDKLVRLNVSRTEELVIAFGPYAIPDRPPPVSINEGITVDSVSYAYLVVRLNGSLTWCNQIGAILIRLNIVFYCSLMCLKIYIMGFK